MADVALVRYGAMQRVGVFRHSVPDLRRGQKCIMRTERGLEIGEVMCVRAGAEETDAERTGQILRQATPEDLAENEHILQGTEAKFKLCAEEIKRLNLPMKLVGVEHLFGGDKVIFYFVADGRVDFRELVKTLAQEYQTRIELRQIGVRDEARLLGDYERCGQPICCRSFIKELEPISMRMAKNQKATLDPTKISGRCGRLMCCLRFEDQTYEELKRKLPRKGTRVMTPRGPAQVVDGHILTQLVEVENEQGRRFVVPVEQITRTDQRPAREAEEEAPEPGDATVPDEREPEDLPPEAAPAEPETETQDPETFDER